MERRTILTCGALVAATLCVYWQVEGHEFVDYDDGRYITENPPVLAGLSAAGIRWAFSTFHASNWHPLTWISHMADVSLFGESAGAHHLESAFLHTASALLLFFALRRMTGRHWRSAFVAAMFALHPLHVESVAWAAERKDVLSAFFWMLTLLLYVRYVERPDAARYLATLGSFVLGLLSKPMVVTLPFVLLLLDVWPLGRLAAPSAPVEAETLAGTRRRSIARRLVLEKLPFLGLSLASSLVTLYAQHSGGTVASVTGVPLDFRVLNAALAYAGYLGKMMWPARLAVIYPLPQHIALADGLLAALFIAAITVPCVVLARRHPYLLVGWLWYLGTLVPVIGLVQVGRQAMADRYTYVPLVGVFVMIAWGVPSLASRLGHGRAAFGVLAVGCLLTASACTWWQVRYWKDSITLFQRAIEVVPDNDLAHGLLGFSLMKVGRLDEAIRHYAEAVRVSPDDGEAHANLAYALERRGRVPEAEFHYLAAIDLDPGHVGARNNLARLHVDAGRLEQAERLYRDSLRRAPDDARTHVSLGLTLAMQGRLDAAMQCFRDALRLAPDLAEAHYNLGAALARQGRFSDAVLHFREAVRLDPDSEQIQGALQEALRRLEASPES